MALCVQQQRASIQGEHFDLVFRNAVLMVSTDTAERQLLVGGIARIAKTLVAISPVVCMIDVDKVAEVVDIDCRTNNLSA
eukprot:11270852-Ditylum_brightwellii.AAC.1